jgi:formamidopyrimidine-DNA glycosylase
MPELPEVETVRRQLEPALRDATITGLEIRDPRWCAPLNPAQLGEIVVGRRVHALRRRGKYLDWVLDEEIHLLMHLRMTGTLLLDPPADTPYTRVEITLDAVRRVRFVDPRRFGTGWLVAGDEALEQYFATRLGIEPFDDAFTPALLRALARGRRVPIKTFLLDQRMIAGIGNIYADEILFDAGLRFDRESESLSTIEIRRLHRAIAETLTEAIKHGGSTLDDEQFVDPDGVPGTYQQFHQVYNREGQACFHCRQPIERETVRGRSTYYCSKCQS